MSYLNTGTGTNSCGPSLPTNNPYFEDPSPISAMTLKIIEYRNQLMNERNSRIQYSLGPDHWSNIPPGKQIFEDFKKKFPYVVKQTPEEASEHPLPPRVHAKTRSSVYEGTALEKFNMGDPNYNEKYNHDSNLNHKHNHDHKHKHNHEHSHRKQDLDLDYCDFGQNENHNQNKQNHRYNQNGCSPRAGRDMTTVVRECRIREATRHAEAAAFILRNC